MNWTPMEYVKNKMDRWPSEMTNGHVGRVYKLDDGTTLLVGDVNENGGVCDDCCEDRRVVAFSDDLVSLLPGAAPSDPGAIPRSVLLCPDTGPNWLGGK